MAGGPPVKGLLYHTYVCTHLSMYIRMYIPQGSLQTKVSTFLSSHGTPFTSSHRHTLSFLHLHTLSLLLLTHPLPPPTHPLPPPPTHPLSPPSHTPSLSSHPHTCSSGWNSVRGSSSSVSSSVTLKHFRAISKYSSCFLWDSLVFACTSFS